MSTVIEENVNPIEKVDCSSLLLASTVHQKDIPIMLENSLKPHSLVLKTANFFPMMLGVETGDSVDHDDVVDTP